MKINRQSFLSIGCFILGLLSFLPYILLWLFSKSSFASFEPIFNLFSDGAFFAFLVTTLFIGIPLGLLGISFGALAFIQKTGKFIILTRFGILFSVCGIISHFFVIKFVLDALTSGTLLN